MSCQHWKSTCYVFTAGSKWGRQSWRGFGNGRHRGQTNPWMHLFLPFAESLNLYSCGTRPRQNYPVESWARRINFINHRHSRCTIHYHPTLASTLYIDIISLYFIALHCRTLHDLSSMRANTYSCIPTCIYTLYTGIKKCTLTDTGDFRVTAAENQFGREGDETHSLYARIAVKR